MNELKQKWATLKPPARLAIGVGGALVALLVVLRILPALIAGMGIGVFLAVLLVPYWLPTIIAFKRQHPSRGAVLAINFFLGWTFVGWVVAIAWALSDNSAKGGASVTVNTHVFSHVPGSQAHPTAPAYQVGDVVNGQRFNGLSWEPIAGLPTATAQPLPTLTEGSRPAAGE
jgi:hypothetical protein